MLTSILYKLSYGGAHDIAVVPFSGSMSIASGAKYERHNESDYRKILQIKFHNNSFTKTAPIFLALKPEYISEQSLAPILWNT